MLTARPDRPEPLPYRAFVAELLVALGRNDQAPPGPEVHLVDDLAFDSLELYELQVLLEELCGCELPTELLATVDTLGAAYEWYCTKLGQEPGAATDPRLDPDPPPGEVTMATRRVRLRPLEPVDYEWLHGLTTRPEHLVRWRDRGRTYRIEEWVERLWAGVAAQFVVVGRTGATAGVPLGLVTLYHHDAPNRHARLAAIFDDTVPGSAGWRLEGVGLLLHYAFETFDLLKVYAEVVEFNLPAFASGEGHFFVEEGRLEDYEYAHGRYWAVHVLAVTRARFAAYRAEWLPRSLGTRLLAAVPTPAGAR